MSSFTLHSFWIFRNTIQCMCSNFSYFHFENPSEVIAEVQLRIMAEFRCCLWESGVMTNRRPFGAKSLWACTQHRHLWWQLGKYSRSRQNMMTLNTHDGRRVMGDRKLASVHDVWTGSSTSNDKKSHWYTSCKKGNCVVHISEIFLWDVCAKFAYPFIFHKTIGDKWIWILFL